MYGDFSNQEFLENNTTGAFGLIVQNPSLQGDVRDWSSTFKSLDKSIMKI